MGRIGIIACVLTGSASAGSACSPASFHWVATALAGNDRVRVNPDCSFAGAGMSRRHTGEGQRSVDNGKGLVSQVLSFGDDCGAIAESLLVAECATGNSVVLLWSDSRVNIAGDDSIGDVTAKAEQAGAITFDEKAFREYNGLRQAKDHFDPLCGCKLFYPDSPGARN